MAVSLNQASSQTRKRRRSRGQVFSEINVTPFVDVMLVLLVIFMVTAPMLTVGVPVDLPKTKAAKMNTQTDPLIVSVDMNGKAYLQETELDGDALIERLIAVSGNNPDTKIYVRGDQKINYGRVMEVMGIIAAAGFTKVSLIAEMPSGPSKNKGKPLMVGSPGTSAPHLQPGQMAPTPVPPGTHAPLQPSGLAPSQPSPPAAGQKTPVPPQAPAARPMRPAAPPPGSHVIRSQ